MVQSQKVQQVLVRVLSHASAQLPGRQNPENVDSAVFHQLITPQHWTEGRPSQQWRIQNYIHWELATRIWF